MNYEEGPKDALFSLHCLEKPLQALSSSSAIVISPQSVSNIVWSLGKMGYQWKGGLKEEATREAILTLIERCIGGFNVQVIQQKL